MTLAEEVTCVDSPTKSTVYSRGTLGFMERNGLRGRRNNTADRPEQQQQRQASVGFEELDGYSDDDYHTPPQRYHVREYDEEDDEALPHRRDSLPRERHRYVRR